MSFIIASVFCHKLMIHCSVINWVSSVINAIYSIHRIVLSKQLRCVHINLPWSVWRRLHPNSNNAISMEMWIAITWPGKTWVFVENVENIFDKTHFLHVIPWREHYYVTHVQSAFKRCLIPLYRITFCIYSCIYSWATPYIAQLNIQTKSLMPIYCIITWQCYFLLILSD